MTDGWYETVAAIGGITGVTIYALFRGELTIASVGLAALSGYLGAKALAMRSHA